MRGDVCTDDIGQKEKRCDNWLHAEMGTEIGREDRAGTMGKREGGVVQGKRTAVAVKGAPREVTRVTRSSRLVGRNFENKVSEFRLI